MTIPQDDASPAPDRAPAPAARILAQSLGSAIAIAAMIWLADASHTPLMMVPFATSIVLVMGMPEAEPAQPLALIGGHLVSTLAGFAALKLFGPELWAAAVGVGLAAVAMHCTRTFHPPAGIDPLVIVTANPQIGFLIMPVAAGAVLLALFAFVWHKLWRSGPWPRRRAPPP